MWVMIRMPEGRLTLQVPRQPISLVMSGKIGFNLSPLLVKLAFSLSGAEEYKFQRIYHLKAKAKKRNWGKGGFGKEGQA